MVVRRVTNRKTLRVKKTSGIAEIVAVLSGLMVAAGMTRHESMDRGMGI